MKGPKRILIIAGPNGAGKTTYAESYLPGSGYRHFVNADLIAKGLSPFDPDAAAIPAGRIMLQRLDELAARGESFAFETTLSGMGYVERIRAWRLQGYFVTLAFITVESAELSVSRVALRVRMGGHDIPPEVIQRRFMAGLSNFQIIYRDLVDDWVLLDNSSDEHVIIDWKRDEDAPN